MEKGWWDKIDLMVFCMKWPSTWSWACLFFLATWLAITWMKCQNIRYSATLLKYKILHHFYIPLSKNNIILAKKCHFMLILYYKRWCFTASPLQCLPYGLYGLCGTMWIFDLWLHDNHMCINLHVISREAGRQGGRGAGRAGRGAGTQAEGQGGEQAVGAPGKTARRRCAEMSQMPPPKNSVTCAAVQFWCVSTPFQITGSFNWNNCYRSSRMFWSFKHLHAIPFVSEK